ncbi:rRNA methyltransferase [Actinoalloteichus caeruleus]|uniref:rRNA methyltransferase n=1 Tax=Actinoalloteichus cyanogriseus TaxID=2893586 RepID=UPI0004A9F935|nr:rRNA methyltransferase [Actinoalloteichus caeruleus]
MGYQHAVTRENYQDLASGAVLRSAPGLPAFPVRLASEVFQRAVALRGRSGPVTVWDPCCGSGYLLTVLGLLHRAALSAVVASDLDERALSLARANLALLSDRGLTARAAELRALAERHGKPGYRETADTALRLRARLAGGGDVPVTVLAADAFDPAPAVADRFRDGPPDIVVTDVPYGERTDWLGPAASGGTAGMLGAVASVVPAETVLVVATRGRKVPLAVPRPAGSLRVGTRAVALLRAGQVVDPS